ncbi:13019_t:CDS:2 [Cetraspora pellucida]|uniref:13019_t:CDS:1 n=1 Tax=Cetraspora pellucida TaxID=1433469 RepID=A0A9N9ECV1_9GLOM|nr:13019_t:CDS:2 [Cetraspora pellucida]
MALDRFREIKAISQVEMDLCFLGMIDESIKPIKSASKTPKLYLVTNYNFSEISICQTAWLTIHEIVEVFGVYEEEIPHQINYLIPENESVGKGADAVISLVHNYFIFYDAVPNEMSIAHVNSIPRTEKEEIIMPEIMSASGLSLNRQWYLYNEV